MPCSWEYSLSGLWRILASHGLCHKRGRDHVRSPDPAYQAKVTQIAIRRAEVEAQPERAVLLYLDEVTSYRQPSLAAGYAVAGNTDPRAERSVKSNATTRVIATLELQTSPFPFFTPPSWPTEPGPQARRLNLPIQLVQLPTYAPWANPIEKLWRWLKQDVLHLHRHADDLPTLRNLVLDFLTRFNDASPDLLRYVGLPLPTSLFKRHQSTA